MSAPSLYKSQNLDHLGLVAALYDELGIKLSLPARSKTSRSQVSIRLG